MDMTELIYKGYQKTRFPFSKSQAAFCPPAKEGDNPHGTEGVWVRACWAEQILDRGKWALIRVRVD